MNSKYVQQALVFEPSNYINVQERFPSVARLLHGALGLSTESAEVLDLIKKQLIYGKTIDEQHLKEELGDIMWYIALLADELNLDFTSICNENIRKLTNRYGDRFSEYNAINNR